MRASPDVLRSLERDYERAVVSWVDDEGYPLNVPTGFRTDPARGTVLLDGWGSGELGPRPDEPLAVTFSHIRPLPGEGYDQRRYVNLRGGWRPVGDAYELEPDRVYGWDENETPFFQYSEESVPRAHRYLGGLSRRVGRAVRPRLALGWLALRATRLPFVTATVVSVFLGVAVAAFHGPVRPLDAGLTLVAAVAIHLGLNVANDVFDTLSGADEANTTPTPFSGGSRVVQYGLVSLRGMVLLSAAFYAVGAGLGGWLAWRSGSWAVVWVGAIGVAISIAYTAPPLRLVHRGLGEIAVAGGFGPVVVLGTYAVQTGTLSWEAAYASLPAGLLVGLILYVNELPDRPADAAVGKRTIPVRLPDRFLAPGYAVGVAAVYVSVAVGALVGVLPLPTLAALATVPMAVSVGRGVRAHADEPYELMGAMGRNIGLHLVTGLLLVAGYVAATILGR